MKTATASANARLEAEREEYWPAFVAWIEEMRADPSLPIERIKDDYIRRDVNTAPLDKPDDYQTKQLTNHFLEQHEKWSPLKKAIDQAVADEGTFQAEIPLVMVMRDDKPRETFVMLRGNYETPGEQVQPGIPDFLPSLSRAGKTDRLALAQWLVSPEQPLTARVTVNRYWQLMFGRGLVTTPDDFGLQGAQPSHPEMLDWLAVEFRESGWDVQALLRGIVLSRTYRQTAEVAANVIGQDPENIWLARGPRGRLDSRLLRDQALAISGLLTTELGGPPVAPYQPDGIWESMSLDKTHYMQGEGEDLYRRSLYTVWRRVVTPANFFDVPSRQNCSVKLRRTSTPLHALTTLNDVTYVEAARTWADRLTILPDDDSRIKRMFFAATAREPDERELVSLRAALQHARSHFAHRIDEAKKLISTGEAANQSSLLADEHAAWATLCLLVLNLDETLCK